MSTLTALKPRPETNSSPRSSPPRKTGVGSRKEFLQLSVLRRRQILKSQALAAQAHYAKDSAWRDWEAADLTSA